MADAIRTSRLTKSYGPRVVVDRLSLRVSQGTVYALLGRNGAGKSTALKMLVGMVRPDCGRIELLGQELAELPAAARASIAYIAEGHPLYGWMSVREAVAFHRAFYPNAPKSRLDRILDHFALPPKARVSRLSKGQLAQLSLTLALAPDPELLILDDPTLGLDTNVRRDFLESMIQIIQRRGRTILFSSHVLTDVERVADRVGIMIDGVLRVDCPAEHFKTSIRRVVVEFDREPPNVPPLPGLLSDWRVGTQRQLVFVGFGTEQRAALEALSPMKIDEVELNLEDAFIEYTRGPRRSLELIEEANPNAASTGTQGIA